MDTTAYGAIVLAGGGARRMGGVSKPVVRVGGVPMIERVLAAVAPAGAPLVVGPSDLVLPPGVTVIQEAPPGGGPAAAVAAAFAASPGPLAPIVAIVAGDLPLLTVHAVRALLRAAGTDGVDGAVYVDTAGRPQWLCGAWRTAALDARVAALAAERSSALAERSSDERHGDRPTGERERHPGRGRRLSGEVPGRAGAEPQSGSLAGVALRDLFGALSFARLPASAAVDDQPPTAGIQALADTQDLAGGRDAAEGRAVAGGRPAVEGRAVAGGRAAASRRDAAHGDRSDGRDGASGRDAAVPCGRHLVGARAEDLPPWFDCDTEDDLRRAEEWLTR